MTILLSHLLDEFQPNWPGAPGFHARPCHEVAKGDIANTHVLEIYTHYGTHVDAPFHFLPDGKNLADLPITDFVYSSPVVIDLPLGAGELVSESQIRERVDLIRDHDLVLFRSGFERFRSDAARYSEQGPGWSAAAARTLREECPEVRAIALDWLSLCSFADADEGAHAHRILLSDDERSHRVLIFEDVRISALDGLEPQRVYALPLFIGDLDGSPCTIVAEVSPS